MAERRGLRLNENGHCKHHYNVSVKLISALMLGVVRKQDLHVGHFNRRYDTHFALSFPKIIVADPMVAKATHRGTQY